VICPQCQTANEEYSTSCGNCGTPSPVPVGLPDNLFIAAESDPYLPSSSASQYPRVPGEQYLPDNRAGQYIPAGRAQAGQFRPDVRRLTRVEQMTGGATLIVLISLFLPWFGFDEIGTSISGTSAHGYLAIAVLVEVLLAGYLLWRSGWEEFPVGLPINHEVLLLAATGLQFVLVAVAFLDVPVAGLSREFGAFLALIASVAAVGLAVGPGLRSRQRRSRPARFGTDGPGSADQAALADRPDRRR
jgi:hypothetical protein